MGTLAFGIAGAAIGSAFGDPMLGFQVGAIAGGLLFPQTQRTERGQLSDLRVTGSGYGAMIPVVYGNSKLPGNIIWSTNLVQHVNTQGGGLGKGGAQQVQTYSYTASFAVLVCEGPITGIAKIWGQDIILYDSTQNPPNYAHRQMTVYLGGEDQLPDPVMEAALGTGNVPAYRGCAYVLFENLDLTPWNGTIPQIIFELLPDPLLPLRVSDVFDDIANRCGLDPTQYAFEAAWDDVIGFSIMQNQSGVASMSDLLSIYGSDLAAANGMVIAVRRGEPTVADIPSSDLGATDSRNSNPVSLIDTTRLSTTVLPQRFDLNYISVDIAFNQGTQSGIKFDRTNPTEIQSLQTYTVMRDVDARAQADRLLITQWTERDSHVINLSPEYSFLCAGSPVNLEISGIMERCRVIEIDQSALSFLSVTLVADHTGGQATGTGSMGQPGTASPHVTATPTAPPQSAVYYFDVWANQELRDEDGLAPGFYIATTFPQASVYYSLDDVTYVSCGTVETASDIGLTTSTLSSAGAIEGIVDTTNNVGVSLIANGPLVSTSAQDVLTGTNASLIGDEISGYQVATATGTYAFTLSDITRGLRGSPMNTHTTGERFWHLTNSVVRIQLPITTVGLTIYVKAVGSTQDISNVAPLTVFIPLNNYPYATPGEVSASNPPLLTNGDPVAPTILFNAAIPIYASG